MGAYRVILLVTLGVYLLLKGIGFVYGVALPSSVVSMYVFFTFLVTVLIISVTDKGALSLTTPIIEFLYKEEKKKLRKVVFVVLPFVLAFIAYAFTKPSYEEPFTLRVVHPAPPRIVNAYDRNIELEKIKNPIRELTGDAYEEAVHAGGEIYFKNCFFCHGAKLDGKGHFAKGLNPAPLPFTGKDTIAQLEESYVFWRVVKGGEGLPEESAPWMSVMPVWEESLKEEEVWKVVTFIYEYTGNEPRRWEK